MTALDEKLISLYTADGLTASKAKSNCDLHKLNASINATRISLAIRSKEKQPKPNQPPER